MKKTWILTCSLLFAALAGFSETPGPSQIPAPAPLAPEVLATILGEPTPTAEDCGAQQRNAVLLAANRQPSVRGKALCTATASCGAYSISCSSNVSVTSCSSADRNCSVGQRGFVTCNGVTTQCDCPCGGTTQQQQCCTCDTTGDCIACCRCAGGTGCVRQCIEF